MNLKNLEELPGAEFVLQGLEELADGKETASSLLVAIGSPRLRRLGLPIPPGSELPERPEHRLYDLLALKHDDNAHSQYNAMIRRLVSFERTLESVRVL